MPLFEFPSLSCLDSFSRRFSALPGEGSLLSRILHTLRPIDGLLPIAHLNDHVGRNEVDIVHLVAVGAQNHQVLDLVVLSIPIDVCDLKHFRYPKSAACADGRVVPEGYLPVVDSSSRRHRRFSFPRTMIRGSLVPLGPAILL